MGDINRVPLMVHMSGGKDDHLWPWERLYYAKKSHQAFVAFVAFVGLGCIILIIYLANPKLFEGFTIQSKPEDENKKIL
jgi:hypothetical protein